MGNLFGWGGPLSKGWIEKKMELQKLILARMREFGMTPVLPGFSGFVPPAVRHKYPNATVRDSSGWNGFAKTTQLVSELQFMSLIVPMTFNVLLPVLFCCLILPRIRRINFSSK